MLVVCSPSMVSFVATPLPCRLGWCWATVWGQEYAIANACHTVGPVLAVCSPFMVGFGATPLPCRLGWCCLTVWRREPGAFINSRQRGAPTCYLESITLILK